MIDVTFFLGLTYCAMVDCDTTLSDDVACVVGVMTNVGLRCEGRAKYRREGW